MKYTLKTYGWEMDVVAKSLTDEQVSEIKNLMEENGYDNLWMARFDLESELGIDIWDGDLFRLGKAFDNGTMSCVIHDEEGKELLMFEIGEIQHMGEIDDDYYEKNGYDVYNAYPSEDGPKNVYLSVDENKGGLYQMEFESDEVPTKEDFTYSVGNIETPDGDWDFISKIFFKGKELEIVEWLDNSDKAATVEIYTLEGEQIS
jgi:hypothetical protein